MKLQQEKKNRHCISRRSKDSEDGYAIVENVIVLPIVFAILFALLYVGCMLHAKCTIDAAARRGVRYAARLVCDPQYDKVTAGASDAGAGELIDLSSADFDFTSIGDYKPYRYIPLLSGGYYENIEEKTRDYTMKIIDRAITWMFTIDVDDVQCEAKNYVISQKVVVRVTATYRLPSIFGWLGLPETYELKTADQISVSDQDEFIRNVDFAADLLESASEALGLKEKITKPLQKVIDFAKKIFGG